MSTVGPVIGSNPVIESVYIDIPYFVDASKTVTNTDGVSHTYVLDSIYGPALSKIKLSVFESGLNMLDKDPVSGFQEIQKYYSNQKADFDNLKIGNRLNDDTDVNQNDAFFFNPAEQKTDVITDGVTTTVRSAPGMHLRLNSQFFMDKILKAPAEKLAANDVFKEHFKGLYFKVEQSGTDPGNMAMINFAKGTITIKYKEDTSTTVTTKVDKTIVLKLAGNTVSLLEKSNVNSDYNTAITAPDRINGDKKLYLKGGDGAMAIIELFDKTDLLGYDSNGNQTGPNGVSDELDAIRKNGWLINRASLVFNIDASAMATSVEPQRVYLYDFKNNRPTLDYYSYSGQITNDATSKRGSYYRVNLTNHIRSLVKHSDSTNVKLGIVVTENIAMIDSYKLQTPSLFIKQAPKATVMNPLGTVLYGNNSSDDKKKLKLEIYYTKPN